MVENPWLKLEKKEQKKKITKIKLRILEYLLEFRREFLDPFICSKNEKKKEGK